MSYVIQAVLSNPRRPECDQITIPFPIPFDQYDKTIEMLQAIDLGFSVNRDCTVDEVNSRYSVLNTLVGTLVNIDQLDYLAKRLDGFCAGEVSQFQAMAHKLGLSEIKDFINLTYCCQQTTVITDFSDLEQIGKDHTMTLNGGAMPIDQYQAVNGKEAALQLINGGRGVITPYGVAYDNGMKLEPVYNGHQFPSYLYDHSLLVLEITPKRGLVEGSNPEYLYLPASEHQIERTLLRVGVTTLHDAKIRIDCDELPEKAVHVATSLDRYEIFPKIKTDEDLGRFLVDTAFMTGKFSFPDEARPYLDYSKIGAEQRDALGGIYTPHGLVKRREEAPVQEETPKAMLLTLTASEQSYPLVLPASEKQLGQAKESLRIEDFAQAVIASAEYTAPYLNRLIPMDSITVEDANEMAICLQRLKKDGEIMKYCAALEVEEPSTFTEALDMAIDIDDYELISDSEREYGRQALRRMGANDEVLEAIEGCTDFDRLGSEMMDEDGVRQTGFGLVRRLSKPFPPAQEPDQQMGGLSC